jgi:DNA sulfur modification protein DndD
MWILCGYSTVFEEFQQKVSVFSKEKRKIEREEDKLRGKQELVKEIASGIIPLSTNIPDKFSMQEMIKDEFCKVCGREAKKGTDAYNFMVNKLNDLIKSQQPKEKEDEKPLFINNFLKELEQKSNALEYNQTEINSLINTIRDAIEFNEARKVEANKIQGSIDIEEENKKKLLAQNDGLTEEQLQNAYENIKNWWDYKGQAEKQVVILEKEESEKQKELEKYQEEYNNLAKGSVADTYRKIHSALDKIKNAFKNAKEKNTQDFLTLLEEKANLYLEKLNVDGFYGIIRIIKSPDGTARIVLQDKNDVFISSPNQALKTTMYMSVLFAVSDLTALKKDNDYPLIFDAPTSSFSPQKESDFFKVISDINKQCIIFTKSFLTENGIPDNNKIDTQNCTVYRMEKQRPFNNLDLSTIQTKITLIKE